MNQKTVENMLRNKVSVTNPPRDGFPTIFYVKSCFLGSPAEPHFGPKTKKTSSRDIPKCYIFYVPRLNTKKHRINGPRAARASLFNGFSWICAMIWASFVHGFLMQFPNPRNLVFCKEYNVKIVFLHDLST